jgi:hypothetical protein
MSPDEWLALVVLLQRWEVADKIERLRAFKEAADCYINRLELCPKWDRVIDLDEAEQRYLQARHALEGK